MKMDGNGWLKDHIEIHSKPPLEIAEESAVARVGQIRVHIQRVEMIGHVETAHREAQRVILAHFEILRDARIERKEVWEAELVRRPDVILRRVNHRIRETVAVLDDRRNLHLPGQLHYAPGEKTIRQITGQIREAVWA